MTGEASVTLLLCRADGGPDLWAAIEAAQYARIVDHAPPQNDIEASSMADLVGLFVECAEQWDRESAADQTAALERIGTRLTALKELGLFVYAGTTEVRVDNPEGETVDLPLAVLIIRRENRRTVEITLPATAGAG